MLVLLKTPVGFALFKVLDEEKLSKVEDLLKEFSSADSARQVVNLKALCKFVNTSATNMLIKPSRRLLKFLRAHCDGETLAVADSKLGNAIKEKLKIECVHNNTVLELMKGVRSQLVELIASPSSQDLAPVDTITIQAIGFLDDLDKALKIYAMSVRKRYGRHFPELAKIVQDNICYAKAVKLMGYRSNAAKLDFSEILAQEVEIKLKEAALISTGTEVSDLDLMNIKDLCDQVLSVADYRAQQFCLLKNRMNTIAPNLTALVGELVGARLIAHEGSLLNLAKEPGSTVQILGSKHRTHKRGLIHHASLIERAAPNLKGKISRSLAAKIVLASRCDALGHSQDNSMGLKNQLQLEEHLINLGRKKRGRCYDKLITTAKVYDPSADSILEQLESAAEKEEEMEEAGEEEAPINGEEKGERRKMADAEPESEAEEKKMEHAETEEF